MFGGREAPELQERGGKWGQLVYLDEGQAAVFKQVGAGLYWVTMEEEGLFQLSRNAPSRPGWVARLWVFVKGLKRTV